jgi:molybdopterin-guanine dinucleotide biosynthesis protein A
MGRLLDADLLAAEDGCPGMAPGCSDGRPRRRLPGWLVVGAASRRAGKTDFACAVIREHHRRFPVIAVKVTAIADGEAVCPRGRDGCGVCASLEGDFRIVEETGAHPGKDTARLLASGASRVFWVTCRRSRMRAAMEALSSRLGSAGLVVAESNSIAASFEPDLFLMMKDTRRSVVKPTAAEVLPLAHRVIASTDGTFDLHPRHLTPVDGIWHLAEASAAILAGGQSKRMGQDKGLLRIGGSPLVSLIHEQLIGRFDDILVSTNDPDRYAFLGARTVPDAVPETGPLMGIASAVGAARYERVFVVACDIPVIDIETVERMLVLASEYDCVVPLSSAGHEPLFAVYRRSALQAMLDALADGRRRISAIFPRVRMHTYLLGDAPWFRNLNTPADMTAFLRVAT